MWANKSEDNNLKEMGEHLGIQRTVYFGAYKEVLKQTTEVIFQVRVSSTPASDWVLRVSSAHGYDYYNSISLLTHRVGGHGSPNRRVADCWHG
jgi:hypothetical protein